MILDFTIQNFRSVSEPVSLNMVATREQVHKNRLPRLRARYKKNLNPVAAIFGANASGKSTIVKALDTLRDLLIGQAPDNDKDKILPFEPFALDEEYINKPTRFEILFVYDNYVYEYTISYNLEKIVEESLVKLLSASEEKIFAREHGEVWVNPRNLSKIGRMGLELISNTVPDTVPLTTHFFNLNKEKMNEIKEIISEVCVPSVWFGRVLIIPAGAFDEKQYGSNFSDWTQGIVQIDAGISGVKNIPLDENSLAGLTKIAPGVVEQTKKYGPMEFALPDNRYACKYEENKFSAEKIELLHSSKKGSKNLPWGSESDGTRAAAQIIGVFSQCIKSDSVLVIDELDRSFHTELSRSLVDGFLESISEDSRSQLIFTTHDLLLMDPSRLRRDEMWVTEKDLSGQTQLINLSEYEGIRKDQDIRKSYLLGRFGGIPNISPIQFGSIRNKG